MKKKQNYKLDALLVEEAFEMRRKLCTPLLQFLGYTSRNFITVFEDSCL